MKEKLPEKLRYCLKDDTCGDYQYLDPDVEGVKIDFHAAADDIMKYVCENLCKIPINRAYTQDDIIKFCNKCNLEGRVRSLKDAHKKLCDNVDKIYFEKCMEVNRLTKMQYRET